MDPPATNAGSDLPGHPARASGEPSAALAAAARAFDLDELSPAERRVFEEAIDGRSVREITESLVLSEATVRSHLARIYAKLGVRGRVELLARLAAGGSAAVAQSSPSGELAEASPSGTLAGPRRNLVTRGPDVAPTRDPLDRIFLGAGLIMAILLGVFAPLTSLVSGPLLVSAGLLLRRRPAGSVASAWRWVLVSGIALTIEALLILVALLGLVAVSGIGSPG